MSRTFAAAATGLPVLRSTALPELEGTALRLHVAPVMTAIWSDGPRGYALLSLCPGDDPDEPAALVRLPLMQCEALERACAAFNCILAAADHAEMPSRGMRASPAQRIAPAGAHVVVCAVPLARESSMPTVEGITPPPAHSPQAVAPRAQAIATAAAQVVVLAAFLPAVAGRCLGLL